MTGSIKPKTTAGVMPRIVVCVAALALATGVGTAYAQNTTESGIEEPSSGRIETLTEELPQERVYLHFDNTSYFQGDDIWFKCYLVTTPNRELSPLSKTLYVELLNPGGEVVARRVLKVEGGVCHGDFRLTHMPFYSGFYEVRAYTKYMLNFGEDTIFSRLLPVYDRPETAGDFSQRRMISYNSAYYNYPNKRGRLLRVGRNKQKREQEYEYESNQAGLSPADSIGITMSGLKPSYTPFEPVEIEFLVTGSDGSPLPETTFSLSVQDAEGLIDTRRNIVTDLGRMSTGSGASTAGVETQELKYLAEQGIDASGTIIDDGFWGNRSIPKAGVEVSLFMEQKGEESDLIAVETVTTDSLGRFSFVADVTGRWNAGISVNDGGKIKDYRIVLDRLFSPEPRRYHPDELTVEFAPEEPEPEVHDGEGTLPDGVSQSFIDSLARLGVEGTEKLVSIEAVTVKARNNRESDILRNRSTSVAYYDVQTELSDIYDKGEYVGDDIYGLLKKMNSAFQTQYYRMGDEMLLYNNKLVLLVVNYEVVTWRWWKALSPTINFKLNAIKSIYVNENRNAISLYLDISNYPELSLSDVLGQYGCAVFIEIDPEALPDAGKGARRTVLEGYTPPGEFHGPDYSVLPPSPDDYRRTLYWNPAVTTDIKGRAKVLFYNNSRTRRFAVSAETVTPDGAIGFLQN